MNSNVLTQLRSLLQSAQNILIALPTNADDDTVAGSLALYLILLKIQKQVTIVSSEDVKVGQAYLFGVDRISKQVSGSNSLVISLPYQDGAIEKVTSNVEGDRLNIIIEPREGKLNFTKNQIEYLYGKGNYDAIFVIGAHDWKSLGSLYTSNKEIFTMKNIINIDKHRDNAKFGFINIVENAPISQSIALLLRYLRIPLETDPASNLYTGILSSQDGFSIENATPDSLEAIAFLLRSKAKRLNGGTSQEDSSMASTNNIDYVENQRVSENPTDDSEPEMKPQTVQDGHNAPDDWLKPKIFTTHNN